MTNAIEPLNAKLRRAVRAHGHFPTDESALKLLFRVLNLPKKNGEFRRASGHGESAILDHIEGRFKQANENGLSRKLTVFSYLRLWLATGTPNAARISGTRGARGAFEA